MFHQSITKQTKTKDKKNNQNKQIIHKKERIHYIMKRGVCIFVVFTPLSTLFQI
jgi:hypothetical protein